MKRSPLKRTSFVRRQTRLKNASVKRRKLNAAVKDFRQELKQEVGHCEICKRPNDCLDCHEIARGGIRSKALNVRAAILVLCRECHRAIDDYPRLWSTERQAAVLRDSRPADFSLEILNGLLLRKIDASDVDNSTIRGMW